jgi:hypothetical protein
VIVHVVMIEPRANLDPAAIDAAVADLARAAKEIPSIRRIRIGRRAIHGRAGYEQAMVIDYAFVALIEFDDQSGLDEYLRHPSHTSLSRHFATLGERSLAYDYDVSELEVQG